MFQTCQAAQYIWFAETTEVAKMDFHIWDFSSHIEFRLSSEFVEKLRNMTVAKQMRITNTFSMKDVEYTRFVLRLSLRDNLGKRLFSKADFHRKKRKQHSVFIRSDDLSRIQKVFELSLEEIEQHVIAVRVCTTTSSEIPLRFPIIADERWAFLLGLWFASGGLTTRYRGEAEEFNVRYTVDSVVFEEKMKPILEQIVYLPTLSEPSYVAHGGHKLDKNKRQGVGSCPKKFLVLRRPIREILEKFGMSTSYPKLAQPRKTQCARKINFVVPPWIKVSASFSHYFVEGYINGSPIGSVFNSRRKFLNRSVEIRFGAEKKKEVEEFRRFFKETLTREGIDGYLHTLRKVTSPLCWRGLLIHNSRMLKLLFEKYDIRKPELRSRLVLNYFMNPLLYEACRELTASENLVLGGLIEKAMTSIELAERFRINHEIIIQSLRKLESRRLVTQRGELFAVLPTAYRSQLMPELWIKIFERRRRVSVASEKFYCRCSKCGSVKEGNGSEKCCCGGRYKPISRADFIRYYGHFGRPLTSKIEKIADQTIPVLRNV